MNETILMLIGTFFVAGVLVVMGILNSKNGTILGKNAYLVIFLLWFIILPYLCVNSFIKGCKELWLKRKEL